MAASHPSNVYQVPGGVELTQPAGGSTESVPLPVGGRRRHRRRTHKRATKKHRTRKHRTRKH